MEAERAALINIITRVRSLHRSPMEFANTRSTAKNGLCLLREELFYRQDFFIRESKRWADNDRKLLNYLGESKDVQGEPLRYITCNIMNLGKYTTVQENCETGEGKLR